MDVVGSRRGGMAMRARVEGIRLIVCAWAFLMAIVLGMPVRAEQLSPDGAPNPDASVVNQQTLLQQGSRVEGRITIPDARGAVLIQPAGRRWTYFHEVTLHWLATIVILGTIVALGAAYLIMGPLRISDGRSGQKIRRFTGFERFSHWLTAASFVVLALSGLNITFGKIVLMPVIGPNAFSAFSAAAKYAHNFVSFTFTIGLVLIVAIWIKDNIPSKVDVDWLRQGGGFMKSRHAPAGRFNAGEKMVFWFALGAGLAITASGYSLLFPFYITNIAGMQTAHVVHAVVAVLFVAVILAHIYIGTLGTEGAFEAMGTGEVDLNWAREHHDQWLRDELAKQQSGAGPGQASPTPAE
jgi:formate dehydrogenase subunit gamma